MARKPNKRKPNRASSWRKRLSALKALIATTAIGVLCAFGLLRCLDERSGSPIEPEEMRRTVAVKRVDVGKGKTVDPTLVDEDKLLKEERLRDAPAPEPEPPEKAPAETAPDTDTGGNPSDTESQEKQFPLYGVAFHFHTQFKAEPMNASRVIGYARRGAVFRVSEKISTEGCRNGWYEIAPGGLFACANQGVIVGREPVSFAPSPPSPDMDLPLPYRYAYVTKDDTPQYWRVPTEAEIGEVTALFEKLHASQAGDTDSEIDSATTASPATTTSPTTAAPPAPAPSVAGATGDMDAGVSPTASGEEAEADPLAFPDYLHMRMAKGYFVSLDNLVEDATRKYRRTVRGRLIPDERLAPAMASDFEGFLISDPGILPQVIIVGSGVTSLRQVGKDGALENGPKVDHLARYDYLGEVKRRNRTYIQIGDNQFVSSRVAAVVRPRTPPKDIQPGERWIDVNLAEQTLTAYEGERPVFATVVSTGRDGFPTPTGEFRIYAKHVTVTMDDTEAGAEAYSIEDVPWVQYFKDSYALHGAFWHNRFGRVRSHGCVNLAPKDAKRLFAWTGPEIPSGIHGRFATRDNPGTRVFIH